MKIFQCTKCAHPVYFENVVCESCNSWLGYLPETNEMIGLKPGDLEGVLTGANGGTYRYCANHNHGVCNWLIPEEKDPHEEGLCQACSLNGTIPNLTNSTHLMEWRKLEEAKHRLVYALLRFGLPVVSKDEEEETGIRFDFLASDPGGQAIMTGHDAGLITMNVAEADPVQREATRIKMEERYRTLTGHFRHEIGHYYWDRLVFTNPDKLAECRKIFGDERKDYGEALNVYYKNGPLPNWEEAFISKYATAHPWEDWAETWAHYFHVIDMLATGNSFGLTLDPSVSEGPYMSAVCDFDPYEEVSIDHILETCVPITFAVNSLNRGMGRPDLYPFVMNEQVRNKLAFVHRLVRNL